MIYFDLEEHNIFFIYDMNMNIDETEIGKWLSDNNIYYKVLNYKITFKPNREEKYIIVLSLEFSSKEDAAAFKLRWNDNETITPLLL